MLDLIQTRRALHQIPEIGFEEFKTQAYLLDVIEKLTTGKDFVQIRTWRTGILVYLQGSQPERTIGWRTDIDGLPIVDKQVYLLLLNTKVACMPVAMIFI
ncbi:peptidase family M20/M25/M40 [Streptococcus pneumoniae]|nr:peptidase family M20/M25/M40 [Streptococcus pneumoniae]